MPPLEVKKQSKAKALRRRCVVEIDVDDMEGKTYLLTQ